MLMESLRVYALQRALMLYKDSKKDEDEDGGVSQKACAGYLYYSTNARARVSPTVEGRMIQGCRSHDGDVLGRLCASDVLDAACVLPVGWTRFEMLELGM